MVSPLERHFWHHPKTLITLPSPKDRTFWISKIKALISFDYYHCCLFIISCSFYYIIIIVKTKKKYLIIHYPTLVIIIMIMINKSNPNN